MLNSNVPLDFKAESGTVYWKTRGADTWNPFKSGGSIIDLGTATSIDLTSYSGYENFTVDNFIVTFESWTRQEKRTYYDTIQAAAVAVVCNAGSFNVKKTYTNGILTITYSGISIYGTAANISAYATVKPSIRTYLIN